MKKLLLLTKLILFPYIMLSQVVISSSLLDKISNLGEDNYLPIIIELKDEFNILDLKNAFYKNNTPIKERSSIICNKMQQVAKEKQTPIIEFIQSKKSHYQNLYSTWIINEIFILFCNPRPEPIGEAKGIIADAPLSSNFFANNGSSVQ